MPEGDTIFRTAVTLQRALGGRQVTRFESVYPALTRIDEDAPIVGRVVERVSSAGKHLLVHLSGGLTLRTHMRMNGSWHVYRPGERWQRPARDLRVLIATDAFVAVGFNVPDAEFVAADRLERHRVLGTLGPDPLSNDFDPEAAAARLAERRDATIEAALLDQRAIAGVGNVYKSEILFVCRVHPLTRVGSLDRGARVTLAETARRLLLANVPRAGALRPPRVTRRTTRRDDPGEPLWVYGREGLPCRACGTPIVHEKTGPHVRSTFWCPTCQPATETSTSASTPTSESEITPQG